MIQIDETYDVAVCGGGLAGVSAAVAAARHGAKTCLIQDRPVFGGNSSSEVRVTPHGAAQFHAYARETGIISELIIEERARNHENIIENGFLNSVWDMTLYDLIQNTENLSFHLNSSVFAVVKTEGRRINAIKIRIANAETEITISAPVFIDCTGDGIVADLAGCEWRMGSEGHDEFNEPHAPQVASQDTMGSSIHFRARDMGRPVPYVAPTWAVKYDDADFFWKQGRQLHDIRGGYWWIEIGVPYDTIHENETIRHELTRHILGVWDWIKNYDPATKERAANFALDRVGQVPGKRESRRILGQYFMTEHDIKDQTVFPDEVAFGGWFLDLHTPGGLLADSSEPMSAHNYSEETEYAAKSYYPPYGMPLKIFIARDVDNLMMAGRNVSVTHAALGSVRVMPTTALMGQAVGTAAAIAVGQDIPLTKLSEQAAALVQQALLRDGCFLPNFKNQDERDLTRSATITASSEDKLYGVGPTSKSSYNLLQSWREVLTPQENQEGNRFDPNLLRFLMAQWIAIGREETIDTISVCLSNHSTEPQQVTARLVPVEKLWDYRSVIDPVLATTILTVPSGAANWVDWQVNLQGPENGLHAGQYLRLDLLPNPAVEWMIAGTMLDGHPAAYEMAPGKMRRLGPGMSLSFQVLPPQSCYGAQNVTSGVTRPHRYTNLWRSNPQLPLPHWLELSWQEPQEISIVELTFPGNIARSITHIRLSIGRPNVPRTILCKHG